MGFFRSFGMAVKQSLKAFQESFVTSDITDLDDFQDFDARQLRYRLLWAFFENTAYRDVHTFAELYRGRFALYKYIRNIENPAYRIGDFQKVHIWGGRLDPSAGNGEMVETAIPIIIPSDMPDTDNENLRGAISTVWANSNWAVKKSLTCNIGSVLGDVALRIVDDERREKVYLSVVHPGTIADVELDILGNVKSYVIEEVRVDERGMESIYTEAASRVKDVLGNNTDEVLFETFKDGKTFGWDTNPVDESGVPLAEWSVDYGFIPMVFWNHIDIGGVFGWSELHPGIPKIREADDIASAVSDQIRKLVNPIWLFKGMKAPSNSNKEVTMTAPSDTTEKPEAGRENMPALWASSENADAKPLVAELDFDGIEKRLEGIIRSIESDYPELSFEKLRLAGTASGAAIRAARQPAVDKIEERRAIYDSKLASAHMMAIAIGGEKGYKGFEGFGLDSFDKDKLKHHIGDRPVFRDDEIEMVESEKVRAETVKVLVDSGLALESAMTKVYDMTDEELAVMATQRQAEIFVDQEDTIPDGAR